MKKIFFISIFLLFNQTIFAESQPTQSTRTIIQLPADAIQWRKAPRVRIEPCDLENQNRDLDLQITADANGKITDVHVLKSTDLINLDQKIIKTVFASRFKATGYPFIANQAFSLQLSGTETTACIPKKRYKFCSYLFESDVLKKQISKQKTSFQYRAVPDFYITPDMLNGQSRDIDFSFQLSRKDQISNIKINKSTGLKELDAQVVSALMNAKITSDKKWWQIMKVTYDDHLYFDLNQCTQNTPK